ncbi:MAG TPA: HupE/UreJ family protein [Reyranella sp.]|nr:HupE/UreJ family protein [Reyranella sp.]
MPRSVALTILLLAIAGPAFAHPGHSESGFLHPLTGYDHILAMVGVGMWAALLGVRRPAARLMVPLAFIGMMAVGAAAGFAGIKLPFSEAGVLASVFMLGALIIAEVRVPVGTAMIVVGWFAMLHGYAHAVEAPTADPGSYILGFLAATALLHAVGLGLGTIANRWLGSLGLRALGILVLAGGAFVLATN